jgi:putative SOS response-associated peptidase YedK
MPVRDWYKWKENKLVRNDAGRKVKQPNFISAPDSKFIVFAGLWALWKGQDGSEVLPWEGKRGQACR